jgi:hypothetical protein
LVAKIDYVNGLIPVEKIPDKCRCGSKEFDIEEDEIGSNASCKRCRVLYMSFEKLIFERGSSSG